MRTKISLLSLLILAAGCSNPADISERADSFAVALNSGDIEALAELYTEDARLMPPNLETLQGRDAVREVFGGMIEAGITVELDTTSVSIAPGNGHRVGTYKTMSGGDVVDTGKFIETWEKDGDGAWRISNDIWNSDLPAAAPPPKPMARREGGMGHPHMMILHEVADGERWLDAWRGENSRHDLFKANGAKHVHTFRHADNPDLTGLVVAVEDMEALQAMLASDEGQAAAREDGVDLENMKVLMETK